MTYATQQNLIDRFGEQELVEVTNRAGGDTIDATVVARALEDADAMINGYLSAKYTLPLDPVPTVLEGIASNIARYQLYDDKATEAVTNRYRDAIKFLRGVAAGQVTLGVGADSQAPASSGGPQHEAAERVFTREALADY